MTTQDERGVGSKGRKRGGPRRISKSLIIEAARGMDQQTLTMQAVANELGVDRKALNYHVTDRDGLLRLIATDVFAARFAERFTAHLAASAETIDSDWKRSSRAWAMTVRDSMVATGIANTHFRLIGEDLAVFRPAESVLQSLIGAGFDLKTAGRALIFMTRLAMGVGRDIILENEVGEHPQLIEVRRLLDTDNGGSDYEAFRGMASLEMNGPLDIGEQFEFEMQIFLVGMEARLTP